jgi:signal transduction histidine kinase
MIEIINITLENEMDLVLAHKRSMAVGEKIGLTVATQTAFATAVSEVARTVIDHTNLGTLQLGVGGSHPRFTMAAIIVFEVVEGLNKGDEGFFYAQKLVPEFSFTRSLESCVIEMSIGIPRSLKVDRAKIFSIKEYFMSGFPINAYEEIKNQKNFLFKVTSEQELEIQHEKLVNEKKNEFISIASHEIKTPLTILKAYTQMLVKEKASFDPKLANVIDKLNLQTSKLTALVQQLMDVSQMENGSFGYNMEQVQFNAFLEEVVDLLSQAHGSHTISINVEADSFVNIDRLRMEQVLTNLLGNAAKYSPLGTQIVVQCKLENGMAIVSVSDSGIGMSGQVLESIFEKFYRDKKVLATHPGLGMGLYITSKIVVDHGGKIWAESSQGEGSKFSFSIPCTLAS